MEVGRKRSGPLGPRIKALRKSRKWSLAVLSEKSDIPLSTLSKVEHGALTLNYDRIQQIAEAFEVSFSEFLSPETPEEALRNQPSARISWAPKGSGLLVETQNYNYKYLCNDLRAKAMVPIHCQCKARSLEEFGDLLRHDAEEFILVVQGVVEVHTEFYEPRRLNVGDGVYIDSRMGHAYLNVGDGDAWIVSVNLNA
ncbi:putative transcriptional regulator [Caulobacter sp. AP07]|uniref:helix-turn-helix domain-containing protein n=1 Tax=Caulobacter sp. AP07 TaxID=1144304 RepID=UPI0002720C7E|nr:XRE family transcriptional regulator [Caulobacter sp. AP07]EJL25234.1 putative transcriptional regulator [Caulobacter sp. AP07]